MIQIYTDLDVWKKSRDLVNHIYLATKAFPKEELFCLTSQIRRCGVSIPSNIAEGCGRKSRKETVQFLYVSRGSLYELETQLFLALDQSYLNQDEFNSLQSKIIDCKKLFNGFINYYSK